MSQKSTTDQPKITFAIDSYATFRKTIAKSPIWGISPEKKYKKYPNQKLIAPKNAYSLHKVVELQEEKSGKNSKYSFYTKFILVALIISIVVPLVSGIYFSSVDQSPALQEKYSAFFNYLIFHLPMMAMIIVIILALIDKYPMVFHYSKNKETYKSIEMIDFTALRQRGCNKESWSDLYDLPLSMVITQGELCTQRVGEVLRDVYSFSNKDKVDTLEVDKAYDEYISSIIFLMTNLFSLPDEKIEEYKRDSETKRKELLYQAEKLYNMHMRLPEHVHVS